MIFLSGVAYVLFAYISDIMRSRNVALIFAYIILLAHVIKYYYVLLEDVLFLTISFHNASAIVIWRRNYK